MKLALLNTSIATQYGSYDYQPLSLSDAQSLIYDALNGQCNVSTDGVQSHIGHESTAVLMSTLLNADIKMDRTPLTQEAGQLALVFKLNGRAPEGKILSIEEIESIGYSFGLLTRTA